jgi:hypothetical protein
MMDNDDDAATAAAGLDPRYRSIGTTVTYDDNRIHPANERMNKSYLKT